LKAKWAREVRAILDSEAFGRWLRELAVAREDLGETADRYEELLGQANLMEFRAELTQKNAIDTLYRAGEYEDAAALLLAEATELDNTSFEAVGTFEQHRLRTSDLWSRVQAIEFEIEESRSTGGAKVAELERQLKRVHEDYESENAAKQRKWGEVEEFWAGSFEKSLSLCEKKTKGRTVRRQAERLFAEAEELKQRAATLKAEAEAAARARERHEDEVAALIEHARGEFEGYIHEDFVYWPQREGAKAVYVVPLHADLVGYNIDLTPGALYQCERGRGVELLEPVVAAPEPSADDKRLEQFFCDGRPTQRRDPPDGEERGEA